jgi:ATP-dependent DNA helicase RecQ
MPKRARPTLASARRLLRDVFALDEFPPGQEDLVESILSGRDTIGIMPSRSDRSVCYELAALLLPGTTILVSPDVPAGDEDIAADDLAADDDPSRHADGQEPEGVGAAPKTYLSIAPERLVSEAFRDVLRQRDLALIVIDGTSGVSQWWADVRSAYLEIRDARDASLRPPVLALTDVATPRAVRELTAQLDLRNVNVIDARVYRPNLHFEVWRTSNEPQKRQHLVRLLQEIDGVGIIYASTVRQVDLLHDLLSGLGFKVAKHHGRMSPKQRRENQTRFLTGELNAIVVTSPFGMDLDRSDIRFVVNYNMPATLTAYYQEAGRAGRDGQIARCVLFHQVEEHGPQQYFLRGRYPRAEDMHATYDALVRLRAGEAPVTIAELRTAARNVAESNVRGVLALLKDLEVVCERRGSKVELVRTDLTGQALDDIAAQYQESHAADRGKLEQMLEYGESTRCRWKLLLEYFGERVPWEHCGACDNCLHPAEQQIHPPSDRTEAADRGRPDSNVPSE